MRSTTVSATALLLSVAKLAQAQTFTSCNPLDKTDCPTDAALGSTFTTDFTQGKSADWSLADGTTLTYGDNGAEFVISKKTDAPTISSDKYIFFGKVDVVTKAAPGAGIISSFILESDDLDEIDWEWVGSTDTSVESNFFGKGNTTTYDRAIYHDVADPINSWNTYSIDWTADSIKWAINGNVVRTLAYGDALALGGKNYPQTPMRVKMGNWIGCVDEAANQPSSATYGTCQWAGGPAPWAQAPFTMYVKSVTVQDYSCGSTYAYGDTSGSWQSIKISGTCDGKAVSSSEGSSTESSSTGSSSSTATTKAGIFAQTSGASSATGSQSAATTLATATGSSSSSGSSSGSEQTTGTKTAASSLSTAASSTAATVSANGAATVAPKASKYGAIDVAVIALGLTLGYFVM